MPSLFTLPKELLLHILSYLPLPIIESVAKTHNHHITATCLILLQPLFARRRRINHLKAQFGEFKGVETFEFEIFIQETAKFGISTAEWRRVREPTEEDLLERVEWLDLTFKDDLEWLQPVGKAKEEARKSDTMDALLPVDEILKLEVEAQAAGVQIPQSFNQLVRSRHLLNRLPSRVASSFAMSTSLVQATGTSYGDARWSALPFYTDKEDEERYSLYLCTDGANCVLNQSTHVYQGQESDLGLSGVGFGEWLAMKVFEQEINDVIMEHRPVEHALEEYVRAIYVRRPEEIQSGKPTRMERRAVIYNKIFLGR